MTTSTEMAPGLLTDAGLPPMDIPFLLSLETPIVVKDREGKEVKRVDALAIDRRLTAADLLRGDTKGDMGGALAVMAALTDEPLYVIRRLSTKSGDLTAMAEIIGELTAPLRVSGFEPVMDGDTPEVPYRYPLAFPLETGKGVKTEIVFKTEPNAGTLTAMDKVKGNLGKAMALLVSLTGESKRTLKRLDAADFTGLAEVTGAFFG